MNLSWCLYSRSFEAKRFSTILKLHFATVFLIKEVEGFFQGFQCTRLHQEFQFHFTVLILVTYRPILIVTKLFDQFKTITLCINYKA